MVAGLRAGPGSEEEVLFYWDFSFWVACVCADVNIKRGNKIMVRLKPSIV